MREALKENDRCSAPTKSPSFKSCSKTTAPVVLEELANACADRAAWLNDNAPQIYANTAALYAKQAYLIRKLSTES